MAGDAAGGRLVCSCAFAWQTVGEPVNLTWGVVVETGEAESGEPARGAWTQVSEAVPAVHDDIVSRIEPLSRLSVQLRERETDRARKMELLVLRSRQDLDDLGIAGDQFVEVGDVVDGGHGHVSVWAPANGRRSVILTKRHLVRNAARGNP